MNYNLRSLKSKLVVSTWFRCCLVYSEEDSSTLYFSFQGNESVMLKRKTSPLFGNLIVFNLELSIFWRDVTHL